MEDAVGAVEPASWVPLPVPCSDNRLLVDSCRSASANVIILTALQQIGPAVSRQQTGASWSDKAGLGQVIIEGSLAFNLRSAASFNERHYSHVTVPPEAVKQLRRKTPRFRAASLQLTRCDAMGYCQQLDT